MGIEGTDRELLELILKQVTELTMDMSGVKTEISGMKTEISEISELKTDVKDLKKTVHSIEHDHGEKLSALFDGHKQNSDKLDRIEA